ncbi:unnamed protein product, partial [marine sediment metagenome]
MLCDLCGIPCSFPPPTEESCAASSNKHTIMSKLRVGIIGLGLGRRRAAGFAQNEAAQVCALCDVDGDKVKAVLEEHPGANGYSDYEEMLRAEKLDIVDVATPDWLHLEQCLAALRHECH